MTRQRRAIFGVGRLACKAIVGKDVAIGSISGLEGAEGLREKATVHLYGFVFSYKAGPSTTEYPVVFLIGHSYLLFGIVNLAPYLPDNPGGVLLFLKFIPIPPVL